MESKGYCCAKSEIGNVYYPKEGIRIFEDAIVQYIEYPWITCFEVEGIEIFEV